MYCCIKYCLDFTKFMVFLGAILMHSRLTFKLKIKLYIAEIIDLND